MEVPCVVTDIRGCREAVIHGHNGLLAPPHDADALTCCSPRPGLADHLKVQQLRGRRAGVWLWNNSTSGLCSRASRAYTRLLRERHASLLYLSCNQQLLRRMGYEQDYTSLLAPLDLSAFHRLRRHVAEIVSST